MDQSGHQSYYILISKCLFNIVLIKVIQKFNVRMMKLKNTILVLFVLLLFMPGIVSFPQEIKTFDFKNIFDKYGVNGCFVLYDKSNDFYICYNEARCDSGFLPASTFKIPNAIIALEEGLVSDTSDIFCWDGREWPQESWNHNQTLGTAIQNSCIWVFFNIAKKTGIEKYHQYLQLFGYGNQDIEGSYDRFWLTGNLRISAFQQVEFLRKFYDYNLGVSHASIDTVKDIIILKKSGEYTISGKTGGTEINNNNYIMWLVGYIEMDSDVYFFATNFTSDDYEKTSHARYDITYSILSELGLIEWRN